MKFQKKNAWGFLVFTALFLLVTIPLNASLLITPLQVVMEGRTRSTEVVLINPSQDTNTYRLEWIQLEQVQPQGGYIPVPEDRRLTENNLEDFTVFTPRQVTLKPNQKQTIRIAVRRPADLADGEYKSHLKFRIIPDLSTKQDKDEKDLTGNEVAFGARVYASYSIPIIYRTTDAHDIRVELGSPGFVSNPKTGNIIIELPVKRSGLHGVVGQIDIYYQPNGGEETLIAQNGNSNLFPEIDERLFKIFTTAKNLQSGKLRIVFKKAEGPTNNHKVISERTYNLN